MDTKGNKYRQKLPRLLTYIYVPPGADVYVRGKVS